MQAQSMIVDSCQCWPRRSLGEGGSILQTDWMRGDETARIAGIGVPARADVAAVMKVGGVESKTGNGRESVTMPRINCDPSAAAVFAVAHQVARGQRRAEQSGVVQRKGDG